MKISGLQKMTLLDYPGKAAATVFLSGCNFRCPYCHNASLVTPGKQPEEIAEETVLDFLDKRKGLLDGVCVSGGEPLIWEDIAPFLDKIKERGFLVKLDTNGSYPKRLRGLIERGLIDAVAMDVKHSPDKYPLAAGVSARLLPAIRESVQYLLTEPVDYEFRTTVVASMHTADDFAEIGQWIQGAKKYFLQNFEDSGDVLTAGLHGVETAELQAFADAVRPWVPAVQIRNG